MTRTATDLYLLLRIPFYAWIRLGFLLYLILPQTQGAKVLYQAHVHPFLQENELAIDDFISSAHDRLKAAGTTYLNRLIDFIKQNVFGMPPKEPSSPPPSATLSYTQALMARFNLPAAHGKPAHGASSTASDFYALLASAVAAATSATASSSKLHDLSNSGTLIPPTVSGTERLSFITAQRERLAILLSALDKEARNLQGASSSSPPRHTSSMFFDGSSEEETGERPISATRGLSTRKSEVDFEKIDAESGTEEVESKRSQVQRTQSSGSWMPWSWGAKAETPVDTVMGDTEPVEDRGKSSSVDA